MVKGRRRREQRSHPAPERRSPPPARVRHEAAAIVLLAVVVAAAFARTLGHGFVNWDDYANFVHNPWFRDWRWASVRWAWTQPHLSLYQPLSWMAIGLESLVFGEHLWGYHAVSLLLHAGVAVLLYLVTVRLLRRRPGAPRLLAWWPALAAALWAAEPLRVEVVAWLSTQSYLQAALLSLITVLLYLDAHDPTASRRRRRVLLVGAHACFAAALLSKAVAVSVPVVLVILDVAVLGRLGPEPRTERRAAPARAGLARRAARLAAEKLVFVALAIGFMALAIWAKEAAGTTGSYDRPGVGSRLAQAGYGIWFYLVKSLLPWHLSPYYPLPGRLSLGEPDLLLALLAVLAVTSLLVARWRRWPGCLAAWLGYLAILAPNLGLVRIGGWIAADRYAYLATMPWAVALAALLSGARRPAGAWVRVARGAAAVALAAVLPLTVSRTGIWSSSVRLWRHALEAGYDDWVIQQGLAQALSDAGDLRGALAALDRAIAQDPRIAKLYESRGLIKSRLGDLRGALADYDRALERDPRVATTYHNRGNAYQGLGQTERALADYGEAIRRRPSLAAPHADRGRVYLLAGDLERALADLDAAIRLDPRLANAYANRAEVRRRLGDRAAAEEDVSMAIRLDPALPEAYGLRGLLRGLRRDWRGAAADYRQALRVAPPTWRYRAMTRVNLEAAEARLAAAPGR